MKNHKAYNKYIENAEFFLEKGNKTQAIYFYRQAQKVASSDEKRHILENIIYGLLNSIGDDIIDESILGETLNEIME